MTLSRERLGDDVLTKRLALHDGMLEARDDLLIDLEKLEEIAL